MRNLPAIAIFLCLPAAAQATVVRNYSVTSFDRIRVEGPYKVTLTNGSAPFAKASAADQRSLDGVSVRVEGRTLIVAADKAAWGGYPGDRRGAAEIAVGTPSLSAAILSGSGSLAIDKVKGLAFSFIISGAGSGQIDSVDVDRFSSSVIGAGRATFSGKAEEFSAVVRGSASLVANDLVADAVKLTAQGPAVVQVQAKKSATIQASGTSSVSVDGSATCTVKALGSATVVGC